MARYKDLSGKRFGRLLVAGDSGKRYRGYILWECKCDCGKTTYVRGHCLLDGETKSCGCLCAELSSKRATTHGKSQNCQEYRTWSRMITRCYNKKSSQYNRYGGRGIKVCDRWLHSFENFYKDMGAKPSPKHSIDRINNNGNYCPENCRWATTYEQADNKSDRKEFEIVSPEGVIFIIYNLAKFCREKGFNYLTAKRVSSGRQKSLYGWQITPTGAYK